METVLLVSLIVIVFATAIYLKLNRAKIRGKLGETRVSSILKSLPDDYRTFNNIYLKLDDKTVQIDHVVISAYGIFVIETKNYTGWIYGSDKSSKWVKNMYGNKYYFQNPLRQNYAHVKALQNALELPFDKFIPIVVFLKGAKLKCDTQGLVVNSSRLKKLIKSYQTPIFDAEEVELLKSKLFSFTDMGKAIKQYAHVENIRERIEKTTYQIKNGICPQCGSKLIKREGRYGKFWGCSNYPRCKFTIQE